ncbi:MAG: glycerol kinase [Eubacterium sp.]|nr:glycerol kinase [Eubacterium sp.]
MNILAIDTGTSGMKAVLFDREGRIRIEKQVHYSPVYYEDGRVEENAEDWKKALYSVSSEVMKEARRLDLIPDALVQTAQRSSVIPFDADNRPLAPAIMWQDKRTNELCRELSAYDDEVFERCKCRINPVFAAAKMRWFRYFMPHIYEKTARFMVIPDYLAFLITGELFTDYTYGSRTLLMNMQTHEWDDRLLSIFGVEKDKLVRIVPAGSICGTVSAPFSHETGIPPGIPYISAGGDQQCSAAGQGVVKPGMVSVTVGTGGFIETAADGLPENLKKDVVCNDASIPGQYILETSVLTCCAAYDWFREEFYPHASFDELDSEVISSPPGAGGVICIPYFQGRSTPDWNSEAKGHFLNLTLGTGKRDLLRSLLEGICFEIRNGLETLKQYTPLSDITINGGLSESPVFNRILADICERRIIRTGQTDAAAKGAWIAAAAALKLYDSVPDAYERVSGRNEFTVFEPGQTDGFYRNRFEEMNRLYKCIYKEDELL